MAPETRADPVAEPSLPPCPVQADTDAAQQHLRAILAPGDGHMAAGAGGELAAGFHDPGLGPVQPIRVFHPREGAADPPVVDQGMQRAGIRRLEHPQGQAGCFKG